MISNPAAISTSYLRQWDAAWASGKFWTIVRVLLLPLASLRLTVTLFTLTLFLVWVGTVALQQKGIWEVVQSYFHAVIAWVEFRDVFPRTFFKSHPGLFEKVIPPGGFFFPGGITLGTALFVNLIAAHLVRFRAVARGTRLTWGIVAMVGAVGLCVLVILNGQWSRGLQGKPPVSWETLWQILLGTSALLWLATSGWLIRRITTQRPRWTVGTAAMGILCLLWGAGTWALILSGEMVSVSSMRILWQLTQATVCGVALYLASFLIFGRRAGMVTLHLGIGLLMFGELLVSVAAVEEQVRIPEGKTASYASDIRSVELAIIDPSDPKTDKVIAIPLTEKETPTRFLRNRWISDSRLPFDLKIEKYFVNADVVRTRDPDANPATAGIGRQQQLVARKLAKSSGADSSGTIDMAAAYVTVLEKGSKKKLGTFLLSQWFSQQDVPERVVIGGKEYHLYLRFRRRYKPYSVTLLDVRKDDYIGTRIPKNYSSDVRLVSKEYNFDSELHISMNNPVRFAGETLYQSGYHRDPRTGEEATTLTVVTNVGWMIPYVACGIVMVGMLTHFVNILFRFLEKLGTTQQRVGISRIASPFSFKWFGVGALIALVLVGRTFLPPRVPKGANVVEFGKLPVAYEGRIKPIDTVARTSLRLFSGKQSIKLPSGEEISAIRWLTELIAGEPRAQQYPIFKIVNRDVQNVLNLKPRKGNRYAYSEILPRMDAFRKQVKLAREAAAKNPDLDNAYQRKLLALEGKVQRYAAIGYAFRVIDLDLTNLTPLETLQAVTGLADQVRSFRDATIPYAVPVYRDGSRETGERLWEPLVVASTRAWVLKQMETHGVESADALAAKLVESMRQQEEKIDREARDRMVDMVRQLQKRIQGEEISAKEAESQIEKMPAEMRNQLQASLKKSIHEQIQQSQRLLARALYEILGDEKDPVAMQVADLYTEAYAAFRSNQADRFNRAVTKLHSVVAQSRAKDLAPGKVRFESYFNHVAPSVKAIPLYFLGLLIGMFGLFPRNGWAKWLAFGLLLVALLYHTWAIGARIYISGRPPVTNLYSSAIFVAYLGAVLGLIFEAVFRVGLGNIVAGVCGPFGLLIAYTLSTSVAEHAGDNMNVMQAVLDTQFWLATHVLTVAAGYFATNVAGFLGIGAVICALVTWLYRPRPGFVPTPTSHSVTSATQAFHNVFKMTIYASICLGIFFSFVGTVLGGLWADDSWGRFWGWDPKENGALMIVLWNALVLHARWAGLVRERGLAVLAIAGNLFLGWSWFGVNELGVGLHSYGFTEGVLFYLGLWWILNLTIIAGGLLLPRTAYQTKG